jgi:hypothetical protein
VTEPNKLDRLYRAIPKCESFQTKTCLTSRRLIRLAQPSWRHNPYAGFGAWRPVSGQTRPYPRGGSISGEYVEVDRAGYEFLGTWERKGEARTVGRNRGGAASAGSMICQPWSCGRNDAAVTGSCAAPVRIISSPAVAPRQRGTSGRRVRHEQRRARSFGKGVRSCTKSPPSTLCPVFSVPTAVAPSWRFRRSRSSRAASTRIRSAARA